MDTEYFNPDTVYGNSCPVVSPSVSPALSRYADYLKSVYANSPVAKSDKFPTPSTVYIKLALVKKERVSRVEADEFTRLTIQGDIDMILQAKEQIEMDDILKAEDETRLVVVEGAPGIGKSTFAWELCRQWSTLESLKRFSLVVLLRLREEEVQTATHITDLFPCKDDPDLSRLVAEEVRRENGKGVLFVFDGFDEFPVKLRKESLVTDIISGSSYLPKATVLVTSRPSATAQLQSLFQTSIGKRIEIVGFSEKEVQEYAESVLGSGSETLASFKTYLSANPVVKAMMYNPLNCAIVVEVYQEASESGKPIPHTQTQLYTELTLCLLSRHLSAAGDDALVEELPDSLEDIPRDNQSLYDWVASFCKWLFYGTQERYTYLKLTAIGQQLFKIGKLAFEGRVRNEIIFKELPEGCSDLGLLVEHRALYTRKETKNYNFFHLTLQEYLGAFYISQLPANEQRRLFIEHEISGEMKVVWTFVAGLTRMQNIGWDMFNNIEDGYKVRDDMVHVWPFIIQCFYEAQDVETCTNVFGQSRVKFERSFIITPYDAYVVGYCVSVCNNTWTVDLLASECDSETFEMLVRGLQSVKKYGGGSIEELHLDFSTGVMEGGHSVKLPHKIHERIRSLVLRTPFYQDQFEILADSIPHLPSLTSLDISGYPGGVGSMVKLLRALIKHGKLETLAMRNVVIGSDDVKALSDLIQASGSLRELTVGIIKLFQSLVFQRLLMTVLSTSSLETLHITYHNHRLGLDQIEIIPQPQSSFSAPFLPVNTCPEKPTANLGVKGASKLGRIVRKKTSLKVLKLFIPLNRDQLHDIIHSLEDNHSLQQLWLYHSKYFSKSEQALDDRIHFKFGI